MMSEKTIPLGAMLAIALCLAGAAACNMADGDGKSEPALLPEDFTADNNPDNGNTQIINEGFTAEPNPTSPDGQDGDDRFIRSDTEEEPLQEPALTR